MIRESHLTFKFGGTTEYTTKASNHTKSDYIKLGKPFRTGTDGAVIPESTNAVAKCGMNIRLWCTEAVEGAGAITLTMYTKGSLWDTTEKEYVDSELAVGTLVVPASEVKKGLLLETVIPDTVLSEIAVEVAGASTTGSKVRVELVANA